MGKMGKILPHNKKEIKHIQNIAERNQLGIQESVQNNRKVRIDEMVKKMKIQNQINMDNHERFKNIALGYSIQASRLSHYLISGNLQLEQVREVYIIMVKIQGKLIKLGKVKKQYDEHLNDSLYCKIRMQPYAMALETITESVNRLACVKAGVQQ